MRLPRYAANLQVAEVLREEKRMDFNTGSGSGRSEDDRPLFGGETGGQSPGGPPRRTAGGTGLEFTLSDPVVSFIRAGRNVILDPVSFFRGIRRQGDFVSPLVFALICAVINGILSGIIGFFATLVYGQDFVGAFAGLIGGIVFAPIGAAIGLFIGAGIAHLLVMLLVKPTNAGFEATFRVASYASVTQLLGWLTAIPILGILIALIVVGYAIFLNVVGIREVHATTTGRAVAVVMIPVAVFILLALILVLLIGAAVFLGTQQQQF